MIYCISDIHGCYDEFTELLRKIDFSSDDTLYVLGDAIDRGPESIKCLRYIMGASNIHLLMGNHEQMMFDALAEAKEYAKRIGTGLGFFESGQCFRYTPLVR